MGNDLRDLCLQHRNFMDDDVPEDVQVNPEISVNEGVAESCNRFPVGTREFFLQIRVQIFCRFTNNLKNSVQPHQPSSGHF